MKFWANLLVLLAGVGLAAGAAFGGDLEPAAPPGSAESYTMHDLYQRLLNGTPGAKTTFTGPQAWHGGGSGPMETVDQVMGEAPAKNDATGAVSSDVVEGKTFWGLTEGEWGPRTGTFVQPDEPAPSPKTGQTKCWGWNASEALWEEDDCTGTGQDGELKRGIRLPMPRFTDNGDGTVTDNKTGLIWLKDANCTDSVDGVDKNRSDGTYSPGELAWAEALTWCNNLEDGFCDLTDTSTIGDWCLPTIRELRSLANYAYYDPAISNTAGDAKWGPGDPFNNVQSSRYWSGSTYASVPSVAWGVYMYRGYVYGYGKASTNYVWPVRGGQ